MSDSEPVKNANELKLWQRYAPILQNPISKTAQGELKAIAKKVGFSDTRLIVKLFEGTATWEEVLQGFQDTKGQFEQPVEIAAEILKTSKSERDSRLSRAVAREFAYNGVSSLFKRPQLKEFRGIFSNARIALVEQTSIESGKEVDALDHLMNELTQPGDEGDIAATYIEIIDAVESAFSKERSNMLQQDAATSTAVKILTGLEEATRMMGNPHDIKTAISQAKEAIKSSQQTARQKILSGYTAEMQMGR